MLERKDLKAIHDKLTEVSNLVAAIWRAAAPDSLTGFAHRLVHIRETKSVLKKVSVLLEEAFKSAERDLVQAFIAEDSAGVKVAGKSLFPVSKIGCKRKVDATPAVIAALRAAGLGDLVYEQANMNSVASHFREEIGDGLGDPNDILPEELRGVLELTEYTTVGVRSS